MTRCGIEHPNADTSCGRVTGHKGDHKNNGLVWSHADVLAALAPPPPLVSAKGPPELQHDPINHPKHYTNHPSGIECIDVVRHMNFNRGNAIKYVWRAGEKGPAVEDLRKAIWYLQDEIKRIERG